MAEIDTIFNKRLPLKKATHELLQYININCQDKNYYKLSQFYERIGDIFTLLMGKKDQLGWINQTNNDPEALGFIYDLLIPEPNQFKNIFMLMVCPIANTPIFTIPISFFPPATQNNFKKAYLKGNCDTSMLGVGEEQYRKFKTVPSGVIKVNSAEYFIIMMLMGFYQVKEQKKMTIFSDNEMHPFVRLLGTYLVYFATHAIGKSGELLQFLIYAIKDIFISQFCENFGCAEGSNEFSTPKKCILEAIDLVIEYYHIIIEEGENFIGHRKIFDRIQNDLYNMFKMGFENKIISSPAYFNNIYILWRHYILPWEYSPASVLFSERLYNIREPNNLTFWKFYTQANICFYTCLFMDLIESISRNPSYNKEEIMILTAVMEVYRPNQYKIVDPLIDMRELEAYSKGYCKDPEMTKILQQIRATNRKDYSNICPFIVEDNKQTVIELLCHLDSKQYSQEYLTEQTKTQIKSILVSLFQIKDDIPSEMKQREKKLTNSHSSLIYKRVCIENTSGEDWNMRAREYELKVLLWLSYLLALCNCVTSHLQSIQSSENRL